MKQITRFMEKIFINTLEVWEVKQVIQRIKDLPVTSKEQGKQVRKVAKYQSVGRPRSIKLKLRKMQEQIEYLRWFEYEEIDN